MNELVDGPVTVHVGDALSVLRKLPSESVHCVVTSPPYWGLRDYGTAEWEGGEAGCDHRGLPYQNPAVSTLSRHGSDGASPYLQQLRTHYRDFCGKCGARRVDSQLGLEPTPELYVEHMVEVFREVRRVLRRDGTCWLNLGDSYAGSWGAQPRGNSNGLDKSTLDHRSPLSSRQILAHPHLEEGTGSLKRTPGLKSKDLVGIPWMVAFALRADGWWLRSDIVWAKPNPMPESVTDRPTKSHEYLFLLTKSERYFYDSDAVREAAQERDFWGDRTQGGDHNLTKNNAAYSRGPSGFGHNPGGRNLRSVWTIATQPYPEAHFATFPEDLVIPCIKAGTSEHGVCPQCGAPWERVITTTRLRNGQPAELGSWMKPTDPRRLPATGVGHWRDTTETRTLGWRPTCCHEAEPVPATVLDPFAGSGTTLAVARRLGRRAVGIELQADYLPLISKRVEASALPLLELLQVEEMTQ